MEQQGWITEEEYRAALDQEMVFTKGDETKQIFTCENDECGFKGEAKDFDRDRSDLGNKFGPGENIYYCPQCTHKNTFIVRKTSDVYSWFLLLCRYLLRNHYKPSVFFLIITGGKRKQLVPVLCCYTRVIQ